MKHIQGVPGKGTPCKDLQFRHSVKSGEGMAFRTGDLLFDEMLLVPLIGTP